MKKIQNLLLVALLAACSTVTVSAMWSADDGANQKLQNYDYEGLEKLVRGGLKNEDYKFDVTKWLCSNAERSLDPFMLFHAARARLTVKVLGDDNDIIQGLSFLFLSMYRTMQAIMVCELAYKPGMSYTETYKNLMHRLRDMFLPYKDKATSLGLPCIVNKALGLVARVNVNDYSPPFWVMSVGSNASSITWRGPSFYFFNAKNTLLRKEIAAFKINSRLIGDALKYRIASGAVILRTLAQCEDWAKVLNIDIETLGSLEDFLDIEIEGISSFGLSPQGIVPNNIEDTTETTVENLALQVQQEEREEREEEAEFDDSTPEFTSSPVMQTATTEIAQAPAPSVPQSVVVQEEVSMDIEKSGADGDAAELLQAPQDIVQQAPKQQAPATEVKAPTPATINEDQVDDVEQLTTAVEQVNIQDEDEEGMTTVSEASDKEVTEEVALPKSEKPSVPPRATVELYEGGSGNESKPSNSAKRRERRAKMRNNNQKNKG